MKRYAKCLHVLAPCQTPRLLVLFADRGVGAQMAMLCVEAAFGCTCMRVSIASLPLKRDCQAWTFWTCRGRSAMASEEYLGEDAIRNSSSSWGDTCWDSMRSRETLPHPEEAPSQLRCARELVPQDGEQVWKAATREPDSKPLQIERIFPGGENVVLSV